MKKILIIDDCEEFNFLMMSLFKFHNFEVVAKTKSDLGIEEAVSEKYEVIIVDYMMDDGKNGIEILDKIASDESVNKETPKIMLTAKFLNDEEKNELLKHGAIYLSKPIMPNDLFRKITELIG